MVFNYDLVLVFTYSKVIRPNLLVCDCLLFVSHGLGSIIVCSPFLCINVVFVCSLIA